MERLLRCESVWSGVREEVAGRRSGNDFEQRPVPVCIVPGTEHGHLAEQSLLTVN